jgi:hypothetical protein
LQNLTEFREKGTGAGFESAAFTKSHWDLGRTCILAAMCSQAWSRCFVLAVILGSLATIAAATEDAASWLPSQRQNGVRFLLCRYQGSRLTDRTAFSKGPLKTNEGVWACASHTDGLTTEVTFRLAEGTASSTGVAIAFDFAGWSPKNYVLVPGVVYDGNRFRALGGGYMPAFPPDMFFNPKLPLTTSDNPRLSVEPGKAGKIELLTGNASTPAMGFFSPGQKQAFIVLTEQNTGFGNNGLFIEENAAQNQASFVISAPGVREKAAQFGGFADSGDHGATWKAGDSVTLSFRVYRFGTDSIPGFLSKFAAERKALLGPNRPRNLAPMSEISDLIVPRFSKRWTTGPAGSWYAPENDDNFQLGWVSGFMQTPMLALNDPVERDRICQQLDFVTKKLQGKSGFFYAGITGGGQLRSDRSFENRSLVLTRKNGDTLLMFFKFFKILKAQGHGDRIKPEWKSAARRLAEAFCNAWTKYGQFGQYLDPATGEIAVFNTTGGAIAPAGLALASQFFHEPKYLRVATAAAGFYFQRDIVGRGLTNGACGDITQDPDSETAFGFLESLTALYGVTHDPIWLKRARTQASLAATWVLSYDEFFPHESQIGRLHGRMAGAVFASAQNKHAAPGICTSSGDSLFKLYRATGDTHYAELIRDIQHAGVEATELPGHLTCGTGFGASMERIQPTDAEGKGAIGNFIHTQNAWTELANLLMATELPGVYVQTDGPAMFVFDHIKARVISRNKGVVSLELTNRTNYDARVSVFAESRMEAKKPLDYVAYLHWPRVTVNAGQTLTVQITAPGGTKSALSTIAGK